MHLTYDTHLRIAQSDPFSFVDKSMLFKHQLRCFYCTALLSIKRKCENHFHASREIKRNERKKEKLGRFSIDQIYSYMKGHSHHIELNVSKSVLMILEQILLGNYTIYLNSFIVSIFLSTDSTNFVLVIFSVFFLSVVLNGWNCTTPKIVNSYDFVIFPATNFAKMILVYFAWSTL